MRRRFSTAERGQSIIVVLSLVIVLSAVVAAALIYAGQDRKNAAKEIHNASIQSLTETTLQFARAFFSVNFPLHPHDTYLTYFSTTTNLTPAQVFHDHPELTPPNILGSTFACFIYVRDDDDEMGGSAPAVPDATTDNNSMVYVGAVCTGPGLAVAGGIPTMPTGGFPQTAELTAPLVYTGQPLPCNGATQQGGCDTSEKNNASQNPGYQ